MLANILVVGLGSALGGVGRYLLATALPYDPVGGAIPLATLLANLTGSAVIGLVAGLAMAVGAAVGLEELDLPLDARSGRLSSDAVGQHVANVHGWVYNSHLSQPPPGAPQPGCPARPRQPSTQRAPPSAAPRRRAGPRGPAAPAAPAAAPPLRGQPSRALSPGT